MRDYNEEIEKYKQEAERLKAGYLQCLGIVQYLEGKKKEEKKEKKEGK